MDNITHEVRLANWAEIIKRCQARPEGQSANKWLIENGINVKTYYYWQRRVRKELFDKAVNLPALSPQKNEVTFAEIPSETFCNTNGSMTTCTTPGAVIKTGGVQIEINNSISPSILKKILEVVANAR